MKRSLLLLFFLLLLAATLYLVLRGETGDASPPDLIPGSGAIGSQAEAAGLPAASARNEGARRQPIHAAAEEAEQAPGSWSLRGLCLRAEDATPVGGCTVRVFDTRGLGQPSPFGVLRSRQPTHKARGDVAGRFEIRGLPHPGPWGVELAGNRRVAAWRFLGPASAPDIDLGEVLLQRGCVLRGEVRSRSGEAVSDYEFWILAGGQGAVLRTDAQGGFRLAAALPRGRYFVGDHASRSPSPNIFVIHDEQEVELKLTVQDRTIGQTIRGRVLNAAGQPIAGARVTVARRQPGMEPGKSVRLQHSRPSDQEGRFELGLSAAKEGDPVWLIVDKMPFSTLGEPPSFAATWGQQGVTLRVEVERAPRTTLLLRVRDAATGKEIPDYRFRCFAHEPGHYLPVDPPAYGDGRRLFSAALMQGAEPKGLIGALPGTHVVSVLPEDGTWAPSGQVRIEVAAADTSEHVILLHAYENLDLQLRTAAGAPAPGCKVELIRPGFAMKSFKLASLAFPVEQVYDHRGWQGQVFAQGEADAGGDLRLRAPPGRFCLRISGGSATSTVVDGITVARGGSQHRVLVEAASSLAGRLQPVERWRAYWLDTEGKPLPAAQAPLIYLRDMTRKRYWPLPGQPLIQPDAEGRFRAPGLLPGRYEVEVQAVVLGARVGTGIGGVLELAPGQQLERDFELPELAYARVRGRVTYQGQGLTRDSLQLVPSDDPVFGGPPRPHQPSGAFRHRNISVRTDAHGRFGPVWVPTGDYRMVDAVRTRFGRQVLRIDAGPREYQLSLEAPVLELQVLNPQGQDVGIRELTLVETKVASAEVDRRRVIHTDADGRVVLDPAPVWSYRLRLAVSDGGADFVSSWHRRGQNKARHEMRVVLRREKGRRRR